MDVEVWSDIESPDAMWANDGSRLGGSGARCCCAAGGVPVAYVNVLRRSADAALASQVSHPPTSMAHRSKVVICRLRRDTRAVPPPPTTTTSAANRRLDQQAHDRRKLLTQFDDHVLHCLVR